jgi:FkbM family methyltransferase
MRKAILKELEGLDGARIHRHTELTRMNDLVAALAPSRRLRILDVGANPLIEGEVSYRRLLDQGHAEVIGFEPQPDALEELNRRKSAAETYWPDALGDGQEQSLWLTRSPGFTSIYPAERANARLLGFEGDMEALASIPIATRRLDELPHVPRVDFLKIDVQGSETTIIANGRDRLSEALAIQTEMRMFPIYSGEPTFGDLNDELVSQGFYFLRFASMKHCALSSRSRRKRLKRAEFAQAVDGDAFYVRDLRTAASWASDALKRLAILSDAVMDCPDLVVFALDHLVQRGEILSAVVESYLDSLPAERRRG